jgi:hypothetical protein
MSTIDELKRNGDVVSYKLDHIPSLNYLRATFFIKNDMYRLYYHYTHVEVFKYYHEDGSIFTAMANDFNPKSLFKINARRHWKKLINYGFEVVDNG